MTDIQQVPGLANCRATAGTVAAMREAAVHGQVNVTRIAVLTMRACTVTALRSAVAGPVDYPVRVPDTPIGPCHFGRDGDTYHIELEVAS